MGRDYPPLTPPQDPHWVVSNGVENLCFRCFSSWRSWRCAPWFCLLFCCPFVCFGGTNLAPKWVCEGSFWGLTEARKWCSRRGAVPFLRYWCCFWCFLRHVVCLYSCSNRFGLFRDAFGRHLGTF